EDAQAQLDEWVRTYNFERPHQSIGMAVPWDRFQLAQPHGVEVTSTPVFVETDATVPTTTRRVSAKGTISFAAASYRAGVWLAGQDVTVVCDGGRVHLHHRGVLMATRARRHAIDKQTPGVHRGSRARSTRPPASARGGDP